MRKVLGIGAVMVCVLISTLVTAQETHQKQLFINLTSPSVDRAGMAIEFSTKVMEMKQLPATIFLNTQGVSIANVETESPMHASGKTIRQMLSHFMDKGGKVYICPMCMKNIGHFDPSKLMEGVVTAGKPTLDALFADGTKVMSY
ncbi:MAG: DsrE family protein [Desulfobacterales bacterium]|nr:DsrE family protein [Desulfobacterales bacterium]